MGWWGRWVVGWVGRQLGVARSQVREAVSFYNMFHTEPVGRRELRVCTSLPCLLRGADDLLKQIERRLGIRPGETTPGGEVLLTEVECLCACEMAPMAQLDERFVGPLEGGAVDKIIQDALVEPGQLEVTPEPDPFIGDALVLLTGDVTCRGRRRPLRQGKGRNGEAGFGSLRHAPVPVRGKNRT